MFAIEAIITDHCTMHWNALATPRLAWLGIPFKHRMAFHRFAQSHSSFSSDKTSTVLFREVFTEVGAERGTH